MFQQYYKYIPSVVCISILLFLAFGETYILAHSNDNKIMEVISQRREQLMALFGVLTGVSYYYFCHLQKSPFSKHSSSIEPPSYEDSMSRGSHDSMSTSVTRSK